MRSAIKGFIFILLFIITSQVKAQGPDDGRTTFIDGICTSYLWQLMAWQDLQSDCTFWLYNEGAPTASEVNAFCGSELSAAWYQSPPIPPRGAAPNSGYYVLLDQIHYKSCKISIELAPIDFNYTIIGNKLEISALEPVIEHEIINITGLMGPHPFECLGDHCSLVIIPTGPRGIEIQFQALSTLSEQPTPTQVIYIRYLTPAPPELVDAWHGTAAQKAWGSFKDLEQPYWLNDRAQPSSVGYVYLAGRLINTGLVDASSCPDGGLIYIGYSTICGLDEAWPLVQEYQNRMDPAIDAAADEAGIPGQLLKRIVAIESQFWDDQHINWGAAGEAGLGQLTHNGADTLLIWDPEIYEEICRPWFGPECDFIYSRLDNWQRAVLQNEIMKQPNMEILARVLAANAAQAGAIIRDLTGSRPGQFMDHQDLWRAALVNYNAGPGCLRAGLRDMIQAEYKPSWGSLSVSLEAICPGSPAYVERITTTPLPYQHNWTTYE